VRTTTKQENPSAGLIVPSTEALPNRTHKVVSAEISQSSQHGDGELEVRRVKKMRVRTRIPSTTKKNEQTELTGNAIVKDQGAHSPKVQARNRREVEMPK
jgi:hypothetical protein